MREHAAEARKLTRKLVYEANRLVSTGLTFRDALVVIKNDPEPIAKKLGMSVPFVTMWAAEALRERG